MPDARRTVQRHSATVLKKGLHDVLDSESISIVFQPIIDLQSACILGYEALTRTDSASPFRTPGALFEAAERFGLDEEIEALARRKTFAVAATWPAGGPLLFVNNSPRAFTAPDFDDTLRCEIEAYPGLDPSRIVLEITERADPEMFADVATRVLLLREQGFQVAIDDVGAGVNGLNQIMSLRPNWMKLDLELVRDIDMDPLKQNLIRFFCRFAQLSSIGLIAEGIERYEELASLIELGVFHGQGFFLARPASRPAPLEESLGASIVELYERNESERFSDPSATRIAALSVPVACCGCDCTLEDVQRQLRGHVREDGIIVLDGRRYLGWLARESVNELCREGRGAQPVGDVVLPECAAIGADVTLTEAMEIIAARDPSRQALPLVVQSGDRIIGTVTLSKLLLAAADARHRVASHVSPLTGLPGRVQADHWLASRIKAATPADVAFVDLRDFDAYNVAYGFEMGDAMLRRLVGLIQSSAMGQAAVFLAHLGEDRFMLASPMDLRDRLDDLIEAFNRVRPEFFTPVDIAASAFIASGAGGVERTYPLTSLRVVYVRNAIDRIDEPRELYQLASQLRMRARRDHAPDVGSEVIVDEREPTTAARRAAG